MRRLAALLLLASCASSPNPVPVDDGPRVLLWEARRDGATTYLLGSIHMASEGLGLDAAIEDAWRRSDVLVVEAEPGDPARAQALVMRMATLPEGRSLHQLLSPERMEDLTTALGRYAVPAAAVDRFKPWFAAMMLGLLDLQAAGFRPENGIDQVFLQRKEKPVVQLESMEGQLALFDQLPADLQQAMVSDAVISSGQAVRQLRAIEGAWKAGDVEALEHLAFDDLEAHPELKPFYEKVIFERNDGMAESITGLHGNGKTHFVIVGASHLLGPRGIPARLSKEGFEVERVRALGVAAPGAQTAMW